MKLGTVWDCLIKDYRNMFDVFMPNLHEKMPHSTEEVPWSICLNKSVDKVGKNGRDSIPGRLDKVHCATVNVLRRFGEHRVSL